VTPLALVAIGGHALLPASAQATAARQRANARRTARGLVQLIETGFNIVVTHGNGPQVGAALLRSERATEVVYPHPLDVVVATTQGEIGYLLQQALGDALRAAGHVTPVATVLTQVVVAEDDPAMKHPTKPIGRVYTAAEAAVHRARDGWTVLEDAGRGYRRVVASPRPTEVIEEPTIRALVDHGIIVITLGGGGVPVVRDGDTTTGVDAVVDKDYSSALLACRLGATHYVNATAVDRVYLDYPSQTRVGIDHITASELARHMRASHFPAGTMGPKVESALAFVNHGGTDAVIMAADQLGRGIGPGVGTHVRPD
jgi:carbamate kinase